MRFKSTELQTAFERDLRLDPRFYKLIWSVIILLSIVTTLMEVGFDRSGFTQIVCQTVALILMGIAILSLQRFAPKLAPQYIPWVVMIGWAVIAVPRLHMIADAKL